MSFNLTDLSSWKKLQAHYNATKDLKMKDLFAQDPSRFQSFNVVFNDILVDYSKNRITKETMSLLIELAKEVDLKKSTEAMFTGEKINNTEKMVANLHHLFLKIENTLIN